MADDKSNLRPDYSDPTQYKETSNGAIQSRATGRIVKMDPSKNPYSITPATSKAMLARRRELALITQLRGYATAQGVELPEDADEETIVKGALNFLEAYTRHFADTALESKDLGDLSAAHSKIVAPFLAGGEDENQGNQAPPQFVLLIAEFARRANLGEVIDVSPAEDE